MIFIFYTAKTSNEVQKKKKKKAIVDVLHELIKFGAQGRKWFECVVP